MNKILTIMLCLISGSVWSQKVTVFNNEGRIIKSFGEKNSKSFEFPTFPKKENTKDMATEKTNNIFVIENVLKSDSNQYFLLYQNRKNDYIYEANLTNFSYSYLKGQFKDNNIYFYLPDIQKEGVMSYQLLKMNSYINTIERFKNILTKTDANGYDTKIRDAQKSFKTFLETKLVSLNFNDADSFNFFRNKIKILEGVINSESYSSIDIFYKNVAKENEFLKLELDVLNSKFEKLPSFSKNNEIIKELDFTTDRIISLKKRILENTHKLDSVKYEYSSRLKTLNEGFNRIKNNISFDKLLKEFIKDSSKYKFIEEPEYIILHQGILIGTDFANKEIVYDYHPETIFESGEKTFKLKRQTPDLPILTTDVKLYSKIINVVPKELKANPIFIQLSVDMANKVAAADLSNGPIVKSLESIESPFDMIKPYISTEAASVPSDSKDKSNDQTKKKMATFLDTSEKSKQLFKQLKDSNTYFNYLVLVELLDTLGKNSAIEKIDLKQLNDIKNEVTTRGKIFNSIVDSIAAEFKINESKDVNYIDYLLKFDKEFEYLSKPSIELKATTPSYNSYVKTVAEGVVKKPSYNLTNELITISKTEFAPVRKKYQFSFNAGIIWTQVTKYNYENVPINGSTNTYNVNQSISIENRFVPSLFFSTYILPNDVYAKFKDSRFFSKIHVDVGIDYFDADLLDNVYLGIGFEPIRSINIAGGVKLGQYYKIDDINSIPSGTTDFNPYLNKYFDCQIYLGINLGFNLIPMAFKSLLKP